MGVECVSVPSCAVHFMFLPDLGSKEPGRPFSSDSMLRDHARPHCGWSAAAARWVPVPRIRLQSSEALEMRYRPRPGWRRHSARNKTHGAQILWFIDDASRERTRTNANQQEIFEDRAHAKRKKSRGEKSWEENEGKIHGRPTASAGNVRLPEHSKLMALQNLFGDVVVLHAQAEDGFALGMRDEGIKVIDVKLSLEEGRHEVVQFRGGIDFNGQQITLSKWKTVVDQQASRPVRVIHHEANDGAVRGIQHRQRE